MNLKKGTLIKGADGNFEEGCEIDEFMTLEITCEATEDDYPEARVIADEMDRDIIGDEYTVETSDYDVVIVSESDIASKEYKALNINSLYKNNKRKQLILLGEI